MKRPGVMHVVLSLDVGGTERLVIDLAQRLSSVAPMSICCLDEPGRLADEARGLGLEVLVLARRPGFDLKLGGRLASAARERGVGLIHCHQYSPFVYGAIAGLRDRGLKVVVTEHGRLAGQQPSLKRRVANAVLSRAPDAIYAVSEDLRRTLLREGFAANRVAVITNGIPVGPEPRAEDRARIRADLEVSDAAFVAGSVARLDPVKELGTAIKGFHAFAASRPDARLVLVGDGAEGETLRGLAAGLGIEEKVLFLGYRQDAREILAGFDVYLNTSMSEGISLTLLEAMAAALPIIATRVGGNPEVVVENATGTLVERGDADALSRALGDFSAEPEKRRAFGQAGRRRLIERFDLEQMIEAYRRVYVEALGGSGPCAASAES